VTPADLPGSGGPGEPPGGGPDGGRADRTVADTDQRNRKAISKGVWVRAFIYVIGLHVFGGFIMLLFFIGQHRH
jgi:hypothetical protein